MYKKQKNDGWVEDAKGILLFHLFAWGPILGPIILFTGLGVALTFRRTPVEKEAIRKLIDGFKMALRELKELNTQE